MTPAKCCSVLSHLFGKPDKMHSMRKWLEGIIEFRDIAQIESQPQYTVLQLLTFANSLLGVPSAFCSEALNEVVVDIFLLYAYQSTKYLTMAKEGSEIIPIEDIGAVAEQGDRDDELWVINLEVSLTLTCTNHACSARLELSHTPNVSANVQRWTA